MPQREHIESTTSRGRGKARTSAVHRVEDALAQRLGERKYDMWFGASTSLNVKGRRLEVTTSSKSIADRITAQFTVLLHDVARAALGEKAIVDVKVDPNVRTAGALNGHAADHGGAARRSGVTRNGKANGAVSPRGRSSLHLPLRHRFEDFVIGRSNELAYSAAVRIAESTESREFGPLFIHGECGLGKTHLLQAVCRRHLDHNAGATVRYTTGEQFTNEFISALRNNRLDAFRRRARRLDLLAIDDIHFLSNKTSTQAEFLHTLDAIDLSGARMVMASDEHPRHLRAISRALVSRFLAGIVIEIERPDREMRRELVRRLGVVRSLKLNDHAVEKIAARCVGSVREIEGALNKLAAMRAMASEDHDGVIGCISVDHLFRIEPRTARPLRINDIISVVCERLEVDRGELLGTTRHRRVVLARGLVSFLARDLTTMSYPEIGRSLGRKNHSTVLTAARRIKNQIEGDQTVEVDGSEKTGLRELADQLRHAIRRVARG